MTRNTPNLNPTDRLTLISVIPWESKGLSCSPNTEKKDHRTPRTVKLKSEMTADGQKSGDPGVRLRPHITKIPGSTPNPPVREGKEGFFSVEILRYYNAS
jgi:hypothetical protein